MNQESKKFEKLMLTLPPSTMAFLRRKADTDEYLSRQEYIRMLIQREMERERQEAFDAHQR
jgi:Arc/MetJ-type ribon-helix-helix transcriptional regulator